MKLKAMAGWFFAMTGEWMADQAVASQNRVSSGSLASQIRQLLRLVSAVPSRLKLETGRLEALISQPQMGRYVLEVTEQESFYSDEREPVTYRAHLDDKGHLQEKIEIIKGPWTVSPAESYYEELLRDKIISPMFAGLFGKLLEETPKSRP